MGDIKTFDDHGWPSLTCGRGTHRAPLPSCSPQYFWHTVQESRGSIVRCRSCRSATSDCTCFEEDSANAAEGCDAAEEAHCAPPRWCGGKVWKKTETDGKELKTTRKRMEKDGKGWKRMEKDGKGMRRMEKGKAWKSMENNWQGLTRN